MTPELEPRSVQARLIATKQALGAEVFSKGATSMDGNLLLQFPHTPGPVANAGVKPTWTYSRRPLLKTSAPEADRLATQLLVPIGYSKDAPPVGWHILRHFASGDDNVL